jgi:PadR family transcriptional regulator PadR
MTDHFNHRPGRGLGRGHRHQAENGEGAGRGRAPRGGRHALLALRLVEPAVLALVAQEARHGYSLLEELEKMGLNDLHTSKIYRTLRMMEDDQWIISDWDADDTQGPPRRVYRLTEEGKDILRFWQKQLEENQQVVDNILTRLQQHSDGME